MPQGSEDLVSIPLAAFTKNSETIAKTNRKTLKKDNLKIMRRQSHHPQCRTSSKPTRIQMGTGSTGAWRVTMLTPLLIVIAKGFF